MGIGNNFRSHFLATHIFILFMIIELDKSKGANCVSILNKECKSLKTMCENYCPHQLGCSKDIEKSNMGVQSNNGVKRQKWGMQPI